MFNFTAASSCSGQLGRRFRATSAAPAHYLRRSGPMMLEPTQPPSDLSDLFNWIPFLRLCYVVVSLVVQRNCWIASGLLLRSESHPPVRHRVLDFSWIPGLVSTRLTHTPRVLLRWAWQLSAVETDSSTIAPPKPAIVFNERFMAPARHEEGCC